MSVVYFRNKNGEMVEVPAIIGRSAYKSAVKHGFEGTEKEWLESLKGEPGHTPERGSDYWTPEDKQEIFDAVNAIGANVLSVAADKTLSAEDVGKLLRVDAAAVITVTNLGIGDEIEIFRNTDADVTIAADGVEFAVAGNASAVSTSHKISDKYASVVLKQIGDGLWYIQGAISCG